MVAHFLNLPACGGLQMLEACGKFETNLIYVKSSDQSGLHRKTVTNTFIFYIVIMFLNTFLTSIFFHFVCFKNVVVLFYE